MTPERWQQIKAILERLAAASPSERPAMLTAASAGDPALRAEVEAFLAAEPTRSDFLHSPIALAAAEVSARVDEPVEALLNQPVGPYLVTGLLGTGGMGAVYRATDSRLRRDVAIKVLHPRLASLGHTDEQLLREARAIALLSHPNIATVYDVIEQAGRVYVVMELLRGETLAERLARGAPPVKELLDVALQITAALRHAHQLHVLHCDLKPSNIFLTDSGVVKVLDFGLARSLLSLESPRGDARQIVYGGTPAYMSPEQRAGAVVDPRSDIYSLGLVLREMGSVIDGRLPIGFDLILARALADRPENRFDSVEELDAALRRLATRGWLKRVAPTPVSAAIGATLTAACLFLVADLGPALGVFAATPAERRTPGSPERLTFGSAEQPVSSAAIAPDGKLSAYADATGIWLLDLATRRVRLVPGSRGYFVQGWTPDAAAIVGGAWPNRMGQPPLITKKFSASGGMADASSAEFLGAISSRGDVLEYPDPLTTAVRVTGPGGADRRLTTTIPRMPFPRWSPEGTYILYVEHAQGRDELRTLDPRSDQSHVLASVEPPAGTPEGMIADIRYRAVRGGRVLFTAWRDPALRAIDVDAQTGRPHGKPRRVLDLPHEAAGAEFSVSEDGTRLLYFQNSTQCDVYVGEIDAAGTALTDFRRVTTDERDDLLADWLDDNSIMFAANRDGDTLFRQPIDGGPAEPVPASVSQSYATVGEQGRFLVQIVDSGSTRQLTLTDTRDRRTTDVAPPPGGWKEPNVSCGLASCIVVDGTFGTPHTVYKLDPRSATVSEMFKLPGARGVSWPVALSPDGRSIAYYRGTIGVVSAEGVPEREVAVPATSYMSDLQWCPLNDGLFVTYGALGLEEAAVVAHVNWAGAWQVLSRRGERARSSPDGRHLAVSVRESHSSVWLLELPGH